ncbi:MAG: ATP-binding cassette domain-containing protein [Ruminiclostridium sp.]
MSTMTIENISKKYSRKQVLDNVSLTFEKWHCYGLLGRNGSGKSTLINIIMQRTSADKGRVLIEGKEIRNGDKAMSGLFCMNDNIFYPPEFKLKTILRITGSMFFSFDTAYAKALMEKCSINADSRVGRLSTGESSAFKAILALASNCDYIFLDEPVLGVDTKIRELIYTELAAKIAEEKSCFIITTHLIDEIAGMLEYASILHQGRLILSDTMENIAEKYISLSGKADEINELIKDIKPIGDENIGLFRRVIIGQTDFPEIPGSVTVSPVGLQELFNALTGGDNNEQL